MRSYCSLLLITFTTAFLLGTTVASGSGEINLHQESKRNLAHANSLNFNINTMCGPNCLWQIAYAYGKQYSLEAIESMAQTDLQNGTTIRDMIEAAEKMGLQAIAVETNIGALTQDPRIAILLLSLGGKTSHYAILDKIERGNVRLLDGNKFRNLSLNELQSVWDGYAILIGDQEDHRTDRFQRYFGRGLQISGLLILLVVATYGVKSTYLYLSKRQ